MKISLLKGWEIEDKNILSIPNLYFKTLKSCSGTSLIVQWLRLSVPNAGAQGGPNAGAQVQTLVKKLDPICCN